MAKCSFSIPLAKPVADVVEAAKSKIAGAGGKMIGDATSGTFDVGIPVLGKISGAYRTTPKSLDIDINDKPMMLSCGKIEEWLKKQLA